MISFIAALVLVFVALFGIYVKRAYEAVPVTELKRRARAGDSEASAMYLAAAYGDSLAILLSVITVLAVAGSFVLFSAVAPAYLAFVIDLVIVLLGFFWLPASQPTALGRRLAIIFAPGLSYVLHFVHPTINYSTRVVRSRRRAKHTGVFEKSDLADILRAQRRQSDSRVSPETLDMLENILGFDDKLVRDVMTPRRQVIMADAGESATPVVIRDLHETGHAQFPVFDGSRDNIVGILSIASLTDLKSSGKLAGAMDKPVHYVHEESSLSQAVEAYTRTDQQLLIAINDAEQYVGIITIEDILAQILGKKPAGGFSHYDDRHAVAEYQAGQQHQDDAAVSKPQKEEPEEPTKPVVK